MRTKQLAVAGIVALGGAVVGAGKAGAQEAPSPFHAGQWGIEAYATPNNGGVLYFFSNQTALILSGTGQRTTTEQDVPGFGKSTSVGSSFDLSLGLRHHKTFAPGMAFIAGGGAFVGSVRQRNEFAGTTNRYRTSEYGGYGEIGGQYMPATHFSIGLTYRIEARHAKNKNTGMTAVGFGTDFMPVRVSLYF